LIKKSLLYLQILHALGFSSSLFGAFIHPDTLEVKGEAAIRQIRVAEDGRQVCCVVE
jgi:hypothetical protein